MWGTGRVGNRIRKLGHSLRCGGSVTVMERRRTNFTSYLSNVDEETGSKARILPHIALVAFCDNRHVRICCLANLQASTGSLIWTWSFRVRRWTFCCENWNPSLWPIFHITYLLRTLFFFRRVAYWFFSVGRKGDWPSLDLPLPYWPSSRWWENMFYACLWFSPISFEASCRGRMSCLVHVSC